jgi:outer membrane protein OmpA-like peptidoglycan-associated protein/tetratricopeptide (TPR) repeat protein
MSLKKYFLCLAWIISFSLLAQNNEKAESLIAEANNQLVMRNSKGYIDKLDECITNYPNFETAYFLKAQFLNGRRDYLNALSTLENLYNINPSHNPLQLKLMADCYFQTSDYDNAEKYANQFLEIPNLSQANYNACNRLIKNIAFAKTQPDLAPLAFKNLGNGINSTFDDYFPSTTADEKYLYFTRNTNGNEDIWVSVNNNGTWSPARPIDEMEILDDGTVLSINSFANDGAHTISSNGKFLFFTSCERPKSFGSCDLYFASKTGNVWGKPRAMKMPINSRSWESQPCVSSDGKTLFFVSKREGGFGGSDIYYSKISEKGDFSDPINIGGEINTANDEDKPFIHPDGKTLYFSSDGHPGLGGKDIFMSKMIDGVWQKPVNLGKAINTTGNEVSLFVNALGTTAYLAKQAEIEDRKDYDLFSFSLPKEFKPENVTYIKGVVLNKKTNAPLKASIKIFNAKTSESVVSVSSDEKNGEFLITLPLGVPYGFMVNKESFSIFSENYTFDQKKDNSPNVLTIALNPLEAGTKFELRNVFFETGKFELKPESKTELELVVAMLNQNPSMRIQVSGHTDNVGAEANNKLLSENRAKSVVEYLVKSGIDATRLTSKGFGSSQPIMSNDTPEGKAKNRRTEIEIL